MHDSGLGFGFVGKEYEHIKVAILAAFFCIGTKRLSFTSLEIIILEPSYSSNDKTSHVMKAI